MSNPKPALFFILLCLLTGACQPALEGLPPVLNPSPSAETASPTQTFGPPPPANTRIPPTRPSNYTYPLEDESILYYTQPGDSMAAVAARFGVQTDEIRYNSPISGAASVESNPQLLRGLLPPNLLLLIPPRLGETTPDHRLLPDTAVIFSAPASEFDLDAFIHQTDGYLNENWKALSGNIILSNVALNNSINPRLLLALLEYRCGCVLGPLADGLRENYLMGVEDPYRYGLYRQLTWAVEQLNQGHYGWRDGSHTVLRFSDGASLQLAPTLNAGTVGLMTFMAAVSTEDDWKQSVDPLEGFAALYARMFGDPWVEAERVGPLFPEGVAQPVLNLPFLPGHTWSYSGGPHSAWGQEGPRTALDFSPGMKEHGCYESEEWVVAAASGLVVRADKGLLILDLDGDGNEHTGWVLVHVHVDVTDNIQPGLWLEADDLIGHPSCEGGPSTSTHLHIARKYNGEWIPADGPLPFVLGGWVAQAGPEPYQGALTNGKQTIIACECASASTYIRRPRIDE